MKKLVFLLAAVSLVIAAALPVAAGTSTDGKESNSVTVGISQEIDSLDPHSTAYAGTREVLFNLFEGLVKATSEGEVEPAVASDYQVAEDARSITFTLREGITFHDGSLVTAQDVKYSIERYAQIQGSDSAFGDFEELVIIDENTVQINLSKANSEFIFELTCAIMPESNDAQLNTDPIGTGPFKFVSYTPGESLIVEKYEGYWKEDCPYLDQVTFKLVSDATTAVYELNAGTLDIYQYLTADEVYSLNDNFNVLEGNINYVQALFLNNAVEPLNDIRVRQALCYAVDRDLINAMIFDGKSHIIGTNMIPGAAAYYNSDTETTYSHNIEKAKELLAEAGYPDGFELTITVPNNYAPHEAAAQVIVECLAEINVTAKIELVEFTTWHSDVYTDRNYEATVVSVDGRLAPNSWFGRYVSDAAKNFINYDNEEYDEIYEKAITTIDNDEKIVYYKQLQQNLTDNAASVYIEDASNLVAINSALDGYVFYPISAQDMSGVYYK